MKKYIGANELRLVGKAWEIRHSLRQLNNNPAANRTIIKQHSPRLLTDYLSDTASKP